MKLKKIFIFIFVIFFCTQIIQPIDINHIRDTYSILSDEFKHCSPVHGAVWMETQLLKKYYKYGKPEDFTVKLITELFHLIEDSFGITNNKTKAAYHFSPEIIGKIIGTIENHKNNQSNLFNAVQKLITEDEAFVKSNQSVGNKPRSIKSSVKALSTAITNSLDECGFWEKSKTVSSYPPYTTHAILLGFLYKRSDGKKDLRPYFNALNDSSSNKIFTPYRKSVFEATDWESSYFDKKNVDSIIDVCVAKSSENTMFQFLSKVRQVIRDNKILADPFEAIIFAEIIKQFYSQTLPKIIYRNAGGYGEISFEGRPFSDCTEVTIRDLCNFVVFNQEELKFIPVKIGNLNPSQELIKYYRGEFADATKHLSHGTFQVWGNLMQNIPGAIYAAMSAKRNPSERYERLIRGNDIFDSHLAQPCYVILDKADINKLHTTSYGTRRALNVGKEPYLIGDSNQYNAYALWPSLKNIIILLNRFFGLNLYDDPLAPFKDIHFCSKYFPVMCNKLGWGFASPGINLDTEYFKWNNTIPMHFTKDPSAAWRLFVKWHHAEVQELQATSNVKISSEYKEKLFTVLLGDEEESMELYELLALYAKKTIEKRNAAMDNVITNASRKNCFVLWLQDLDAMTNYLEEHKETPESLRISDAFKLAGIKIEKKSEELKAEEDEHELKTKLKKLKGALSGLKIKLSLLKEKLGSLKTAF